MQSDSDVVGTVMVRDVVSRAVVAHFRAHTAPLLVLQWDASGTLLVTASVHGHNVNVFQVSISSCLFLRKGGQAMDVCGAALQSGLSAFQSLWQPRHWGLL